MTTPRDDIAGLSERLQRALGKCGREWSYFPLITEAATQLAALSKERFNLIVDLADMKDRALKAESQLDALSARVKELEAERDDALDHVEELEHNAEVVSDEFEKDCWKAMRSLLSECKFDWRDVEPDGVTADEAREHIHETLKELESSWQREQARALRAEQERDEAYEWAAKEAEWEGYGATGRAIGKRIRNLASGPEKEDSPPAGTEG